MATEKTEAERAAPENGEVERVTAEKAESERVAAEKAKAEKVAAKKAEIEKVSDQGEGQYVRDPGKGQNIRTAGGGQEFTKAGGRQEVRAAGEGQGHNRSARENWSRPVQSAGSFYVGMYSLLMDKLSCMPGCGEWTSSTGSERGRRQTRTSHLCYTQGRRTGQSNPEGGDLRGWTSGCKGMVDNYSHHN